MNGSLQLDRASFRVLLVAVTVAALAVLGLGEWQVPPMVLSKYWNGLIAFTLLAIACDSTVLPVVRVSFAKLSSSVAFIPFLASAILFDHPWPTVIAGLTALVADGFVHRKPFVRVWFNVAQYMLAMGVSSEVYRSLGGTVGIESFSLHLVPFLGLVGTFFILNQGSVALAVALLSGVSFRESLARILGSSLLYDFVSSSLSILLAFLYINLQFLGLAILILPLFFVRHMYQMNLHVERVNRELLELMVKAIEARDPYTSGHSLRVAEYARSMARELGLAPKQVDQIANAALLHDVGKIYEEFAPLLRKEGRLTPEERMLMQGHPVRSAELVRTVAEFRGPVELAIRNHHENWDGSGYPDGLMEEQIPIAARIILIADTIDAMTTDRPYRKALSFERALDELKKYSARQFDPTLVALVTKSPSIRRLLGPQLSQVPEPALVRERRSSHWGTLGVKVKGQAPS